MEMLTRAGEAVAGMGTQQTMLLLCLLLVLLMLIALVLLHRRTKQAEESVCRMSREITQQLAQADARTREASQQTQREYSEAMQAVNDSVVRMMGEMTRTQQGQMDSLGGQMRAAGRQEEERMERILSPRAMTTPGIAE